MKRFLLIALLAGCAPSENVSEVATGSAEIISLGSDTARVTVLGEGATQGAVNRDALLSAAVHTRAMGFSHFQVLTGGPQGVDAVFEAFGGAELGPAGPSAVVLAIKFVGGPGPDILAVSDVIDALG